LFLVTFLPVVAEVPLVLDPVVVEVRLTKVLIDGGSGLNLIFASTFRKMGLDFMDMLVPSKSLFYGIVPGNAAHPQRVGLQEGDDGRLCTRSAQAGK
jgi:hypothetical protein